MLVYANHLSLTGADAEPAALKAIRGWLKEQLNFGLHPEQLTRDGEYSGNRRESRSRLRIRASYAAEPALCSWVLQHADDQVRGRRWLVEVGLKKTGSVSVETPADTPDAVVEVSCVVKTEEQDTRVKEPVKAAQPRVIRYLVENVRSARHADFSNAWDEAPLRVGADDDSYRAFLVEIERQGRKSPIVLISATEEGNYLVDPSKIQSTTVGLAQVVRVLPEANTYRMEEILGKEYSAWRGAINILAPPSPFGRVRSRRFLHDDIQHWEATEALSQILSWVTASTNVPCLRKHIRPHGVALLSTRRQFQQLLEAVEANASLTSAQLRQDLAAAVEQVADQETYLDEVADESASLEAEFARTKEELQSTQDALRNSNYQLSQAQAAAIRGGNDSGDPGEFNADRLLELVAREAMPKPRDCLDLIERFYGSHCTVLESARNSADAATSFEKGGKLLWQLKRLVVDYRQALIGGVGDSQARRVFTDAEFASTESKSVQRSKKKKALRERTFDYRGAGVQMLKHLKIGVADDQTKTIRTHFHWDGERERIVIGYCGTHLSVPSHS